MNCRLAKTFNRTKSTNYKGEKDELYHIKLRTSLLSKLVLRK